MTPDSQRQPPAAGPPPGGTLVLEQEFDAASLYALRAAVAAHAAQAGIPERRAGDIVLAVHELAANAIRHGAGHGRLRITEHDGAWHCQVTDEHPPSAASATGAGPGTTTPRGDSPWPSDEGHGLWMVHQIADRVTVLTGPGGTTATASFNLSQTGQQATHRPPPAPRRSQPT